MALDMDDKILNCNSEEFDAVFEAALKISKTRRLNPNKSMPSTYDGYCTAIDRVGSDLGEATKKALKDFGW